MLNVSATPTSRSSPVAWVWRSTEFTKRLSLVLFGTTMFRNLASASSVLGDFCLVIQYIPQERIPEHVASKSSTNTYRRFCRFEPRALATADSGVDWVGLVQIVPHRSVFLNVSLNSPSMCHYVTFLLKPSKWSRYSDHTVELPCHSIMEDVIVIAKLITVAQVVLQRTCF